jgi:hypothetical protein
MGPAWRCNFGRTANIATRTCRLTRRKRAFVLSNARSAWTASRASCTMCARTAVAVLHRGRSGPRRSGVPACRSENIRHRRSVCIYRSVQMTSPRIPHGSGIFRRRSGDFPHSVIPGWSEGPDLRCAIAHRGISRFRVRCFASPRNDDVKERTSTSTLVGQDVAGPPRSPALVFHPTG